VTGWLQGGALGGGIALLLMSLLPSLLGAWWVANVLANLRLQLGVLGLVALLLGIGFQSILLTLLGVASVVLNGAIVLCALRPPRSVAQPLADGPVLRVMTLNLLRKNRDAETVFRQVDQVRPDILLLQEVGRRWASALEGLRAPYPHVLRLPCEGAPFGRHGPLVLSRHPIVGADPQMLGGPTVRFAAARLTIGDHTLWAASVHLTKPSDSAAFALQCRQLEELAAWVNGRQGPLLLGGDLNATSSAPRVVRMLAATGLTLDQHAVPSQAIAGTYPARLPLLGLKIDHILVRGMSVTRAWTLPPTSSDHRGVVAEVALPSAR